MNVNIEGSLARAFLVCVSGFSFFPQNVTAQTEISTSISIDESYLNNQTNTIDETGLVTKLSPSVSINYSQPRINLALDYTINAVIYDGLEADNYENQNLNFVTKITHLPNRWSSKLFSRVSQANISTDGLQIVNGISESENTSELRTYGLNTNYQGRLGDDIIYKTDLSAGAANYKGQDRKNSYGVNLAVNNKSNNNFTWNSSFSSKISTSSNEIEKNEQIDRIQLEFNYRFNHKYQAFLSADKSSTSNNQLNDTGSTVGILWTPQKNSRIKFGTGIRGDDTSYILDMLLKKRRLQFSMNYFELVTSSQQLTLEQTSDQQTGLVSINQSLSIYPVLIKKGEVKLSAKGRRNELGLSYVQQTTDQKTNNVPKEKSQGLVLSAKHLLSSRSNLTVSLSQSDTETNQKNTVNDLQFGYNKKMSKSTSVTAYLRKTEQTSDIAENEYINNLIGFKFLAVF